MKLEHAKKLYKLSKQAVLSGADADSLEEILLNYFDEDQLKDHIVEPNEKEWPKRWGDIGYKIDGWWIDTDSSFSQAVGYDVSDSGNKNVFATEAQAKSALAFAQLTQLQRRMLEISGYELDGEWPEGRHYTIEHSYNSGFHVENWTQSVSAQISFPTKEMAYFSLEHHKELWEQYWMIKKD